jgi:hypothetical protein
MSRMCGSECTGYKKGELPMRVLGYASAPSFLFVLVPDTLNERPLSCQNTNMTDRGIALSTGVRHCVRAAPQLYQSRFGHER